MGATRIEVNGNWRALCRLDDIPDDGARGFLPDDRGDDRVFVVRRGRRVYAYRNVCPHNGVGLEYAKDRFLNADGSEIVCYAHGAHFAIEDGLCTFGPCFGDRLGSLPAQVRDGVVHVCWER